MFITIKLIKIYKQYFNCYLKSKVLIFFLLYLICKYFEFYEREEIENFKKLKIKEVNDLADKLINNNLLDQAQ